MTAADHANTVQDLADRAVNMRVHGWERAQAVNELAARAEAAEAERDAARTLALERADLLFAAQDERDAAVQAAEQAEAETKRVIKDSGLVISRVRDRAEAAEQAAEQARNALRFYAIEGNNDKGRIARAALAGNQP